MIYLPLTAIDMTPPPFTDGLCDWSRGDGTPGSPTYETGEAGRIVRDDPDFGDCLEVRKAAPLQRLRYMGEMPLRVGACIEVCVRVKALRGSLPAVRIAARPGTFGDAEAASLPEAGPTVRIGAHAAVTHVRAVIGRAAGEGVDIVWDDRALFAYVGLDLIGPGDGVVRIENFSVRELRAVAEVLRGFEPVVP